MKLRLVPIVLGLWLVLGGLASAQIAAVTSPAVPSWPVPTWSPMPRPARRCCSAIPGPPGIPASLAKLMTIYLVFEELKSGRLAGLAGPFLPARRQHATLQAGCRSRQCHHGRAGPSGAGGPLRQRCRGGCRGAARRIGACIGPAHDANRAPSRHERLPVPQCPWLARPGAGQLGARSTVLALAPQGLSPVLRLLPYAGVHVRPAEDRAGREVPECLFSLRRRAEDRVHLRLGLQHRRQRGP